MLELTLPHWPSQNLRPSLPNTSRYALMKKLAVVPGRKPLYVEQFNIENYLLDGEREPRWTNGEIPSILSESDVSRYRVIFRVQQEGDWRLADKIIRSLDNPILMGHVLAQRYLHPTKYRSSYGELRSWMASYADHPDARRLYKLALNRRPANWKLPKPPAGHSSMALVMMAVKFPIGCIIRAKNSIGRSGGKCGAMSVASDSICVRAGPWLSSGWSIITA